MDEIDLIKGMDIAMINSYDIVIGNITLEELMLDRGGEGLLFAHNIAIFSFIAVLNSMLFLYSCFGLVCKKW